MESNRPKPKVSVVKCADYDPQAVLRAARKAVELCGGLETFVKPGSKVLLKPNLFWPKEPEFGITTHPQVVRAVARLLKEIGCKIFLGDGPVIFGRVQEDIMDELYQVTGMAALAKEEGITLVKFEKRKWKGSFPLTDWLEECDHLVNLPKFKTHELMVMTGAVKNLFGLVPGIYKAELHRKYPKAPDLARIFLEVYRKSRPCLTIVDGITAMEGDGPGMGGKLRDCGLLFAGSDCLAIDAVMAAVMGIDPLDVITTSVAAKSGMGDYSLNSIEIIGAKLEQAAAEPFLLPQSTLRKKIVPLALKPMERFLKHYPRADEKLCVKCGICVLGCPEKAVSIKKRGAYFNRVKCISCFCCQEACPQGAIKTERRWLARLLGV